MKRPISNIAMKRTPEEEKEADEKAMQLLQNSPYKDKLASAGLFFCGDASGGSPATQS